MRRDDPLSAAPRTTNDTELQRPASLTQATPAEAVPTHTAHLHQACVQPIMTSSRKSAALGSLSPKIRSLAPQAHGSLASSAPSAPQDPEWETRIQVAVGQALITMGNPLPQLGMDPQLAQPAPHLTLSASTLELPEAAHAAQGQRLKEARELEKALEAKRAKKEAEAAAQVAEASKKL